MFYLTIARNARFLRSLNNKATPEQQEEFRRKTASVVEQKRAMVPNIHYSTIGRQLKLLAGNGENDSSNINLAQFTE